MIGKEELFLVRNYIIILKDSDDIYIAFPGLTILTGTNNSCKSSLIQSIRVLSMMGKTGEPYLPLDKIEGLGGLKDVLNKGVKAHIELEFTSALAEGEVVDMRQPENLNRCLQELGDLVIIENPEVHLHPKWKADLVELFFDAASNGVKIVLETQSMEIKHEKP